MTFTKEKFLSLSYRQRHKHAGRYLRYLFEKGKEIEAHYRAMEQWLQLPPIEGEVRDRFHLHMQEASLSLKEHNLLINRFDTLSDVPYGSTHLYLEDLRSAFNIGNILRTVEAFRLGTVVFSPSMPAADHPKVLKTAMGVSPPWKQGSLDLCPRPWIALETLEGAPSVHFFQFPKSFTLLVGNEERGLLKETVDRADQVIQIPLSGSKNSLNVASAFAIAAHVISSSIG